MKSTNKKEVLKSIHLSNKLKSLKKPSSLTDSFVKKSGQYCDGIARANLHYINVLKLLLTTDHDGLQTDFSLNEWLPCTEILLIPCTEIPCTLLY